MVEASIRVDIVARAAPAITYFSYRSGSALLLDKQMNERMAERGDGLNEGKIDCNTLLSSIPASSVARHAL